jgi:hypothetical protein
LAKRLEKLRIEKTKWRCRHRTDHALAEQKRQRGTQKTGDENIPKQYARSINAFYQESPHS